MFTGISRKQSEPRDIPEGYVPRAREFHDDDVLYNADINDLSDNATIEDHWVESISYGTIKERLRDEDEVAGEHLFE